MAFDANRNLKIEASQNADGTFVLRTKGLAGHKRAELEVAGVPEPALMAAGRILNDTAEYAVNRAEIAGDQNVGFVLAVDGIEGEGLMLAVRTRYVEPPKSGIFSKSKGVLRLFDVAGHPEAPPLTALATMLVHRAATRRAGGDEDGAREELAAALAIFPGQADDGGAPGIESDAVYNWQNHQAYLALAELDEENGAKHYADALARSLDLQKRELGATIASFEGADVAALERQARTIVSDVLATAKLERASPEEPIPGNRMVPSPIWETVGGGAGRRASIVPSGITAYYFEGRAREVLESTGPKLAAHALATASIVPLAWLLRPVRGIWVSPSAPLVDKREGAAPVLLSLVLADIGRTAHAGATDEEIAGRLAGTPPAALLEKLGRLDIWETEQIMAAIAADGASA